MNHLALITGYIAPGSAWFLMIVIAIGCRKLDTLIADRTRIDVWIVICTKVIRQLLN